MSKIFNIGLPKTCTASLNQALIILGFRSLHNPLDLRLLSYQKGIYKYPRDDWDAITNFGENFYPQLDKNYPGSKFILTTRNKDSWLKSASRWYSRKPDYPPKDNQGRLETFGCITYCEERFSYVYDKHLQSVKDYFMSRSEDLLILNIPETPDPWIPLCGFLDLKVPETSFPVHNVGEKSLQAIPRLKRTIRTFVRSNF